MSIISPRFDSPLPTPEADVQAERDRMFAERQARVDAMLAAEREETIGSLVKAVDFLSATIPAESVPDFVRTMRTLHNWADLSRVLSTVEGRHMRAEAEARRLRELDAAAAALRSRSRRQAELDQGAL